MADQDTPRPRAVAHERIDHTFTYPVFSYDTPIQYQRASSAPFRFSSCPSSANRPACIKVSLFFRKRPDVSYDHFYKHWATVHADLTAASAEFARRGILRYTQHHCPPETHAKVKALGVDVLEYDGCTTMWVRDWDDIIAFHHSEDFKRTAADCAHFLDLSPGGLRAMAG